MRRFFCIMLCLALCLGMLSNAVLAADTATDSWDGSADIDWYNDLDSEFHLSTAEQLAGLAALVNGGNTFAGKTIYLDGDLDLAGHEWTSIGTGNNVGNYFGGTFDGQYHQILHLTSKNSTTYYHGLFGIVSTGGTVKNLSVLDAALYSNDTSLRMGILADWVNNGTVINCYTSGSAHNVSGDELLGGLIGTCTAGTQVIGCASDADVVSEYYDDGDEYSNCDTVGGLIGQWENSTSDSLISDCWFGGSVSCGFYDSGVGGILGANFDFYDSDPGVTIRNCMVATKEITCVEPGNITWISAGVNGPVTNCLWPDSPPDGVELDSETYPEYDGTYLPVVKLVVNWSAGTAGPDPDFDSSACGQTISDFTADTVLSSLQANALNGVEWVSGTEHPVFWWQATRSLLQDAADAIAQGTWSVSKEDANDDASLQSWLEEQLAQLLQDTGITAAVNVDSVTPAEDQTNGSFSFTVTLEQDGLTQSVSIENGVIQAASSPQIPSVIGGLLPIWGSQVQSPFVDVTPVDYYYDAVNWAVDNGITTGTGRYSFSPDEACTRAQAVTFLWRAAGSPAPKSTATPFVDVDSTSYYAKAVAWAVENGITVGTSATTFSPADSCTRAQIVTFLYRAFGESVTSSSAFTDVAADAYYAPAVAWAAANSITGGTGSGKFSPAATCTRAQIVTFLYRCCG